MSELNTLPFDFVQCSSTYITRIKEEEQKKIEKLENGESLSEEDSLLEGIKEGTLYFVLDTKQILLGKQSKLMPMGGGAGVRFADKEFGADLNPEVIFALTDLEDETLPQVDDLVFNSDGCFYRITELNDQSFKAKRLTVAGSGGGGGGGASSGSGGQISSSQSASYEINAKDIDLSQVPRYIIANLPDTETFNVTNYIKFYLDNVETSLEDCLDQYILIDDIQVAHTTATPYTDNVITFKKNWFKTGKTNKVRIRYVYGSTAPFTMDLTLPKITVIDLDINDVRFKSSIKDVILDSSSSLLFTGSVASYLSSDKYSQKIYCKIKTYPEGKELEGQNIYDEDIIHGGPGNRHFFLSENMKDFSVYFMNIPYGIYTFETYQSVDILASDGEISETLNGKVTQYYFMVGDKYDTNKEVLFLCDLSAIDGKSYKDSDSIDIPIMAHISGQGDKVSDISVIVEYQLSTGTITNGYNISLNKLSTLTLTDLPSDTDNKQYTIKVYLQQDPTKYVEATLQVKKSSTAGSGAISLLKLNATGHRNTENSRDIWLNSSRSSMAATDAYAQLTNFTWTDAGTGWTSSALRLGGEAKAVVNNFNPFDAEIERDSLLEAGRTLMFHFKVLSFTKRDDQSNPIIDCTVNRGGLGFKLLGDFIQVTNPNMIGEIKIPYTHNEDLHLTICMSPINDEDESGTIDNTSTSKRGLIEVYINGILTTARLYTEANFPTALSDINFTIGSANARIDLYSVDVFRGVLNSREVVKYYLSTLKNGTLAEQLRTHNDIYNDEDDELNIDKIVRNGQIPVMIIRGALPETKADTSKVVAIEYFHPTDKDKEFKVGHEFLDKEVENAKDPTGETYKKKLAEMVNIEVQGTSSQFYPVKNWKLKNLKPNGKKYQLDANQIRTGTYCLKADYAEATSTHNTQNANFIEELYKSNAMSSWERTTAQRKNPNCRTTIYGYPIVVFHQKTATSPITFLGKYNFNFDKGSKEVFGFEETVTHEDGTEEKIPLGECWEFCDNDNIAGMVYGSFETVKKAQYSRYAWDKWKVIYYSGDYAGTKEVYFPLDVDLYPDKFKNNDKFKNLFTPPEDRGFSYVPDGMTKEEISEKRNSNFDYVKSLIVPYLQIMRELEDDPTEKAWWDSASYYENQITPLWQDYFEARYCGNYLYDAKGKTIKYIDGEEMDENGNMVPAEEKVYDISNFKELYDWIMSTGEPAGVDISTITHPADPQNRTKAKVFSDDLSKYFDETGLVFYYLYTHFAIMADQRAKNMFFTLWYPTDENNNLLPTVEIDPETNAKRKLTRLELLEKAKYGGRWCPWFYDNDTSFGIDNSGFEKFDYSADDDATNTLTQTYQGMDSVLWRNLKTWKKDKIQALYTQLRKAEENRDKLDYDTLCKYFIRESAEKWPLAIYNEDSKVKYINYAYKTILLSNDKADENNSNKREAVINNVRGNGATHFKQLVRDRLTYCDRKWGAPILKPFIFRPNNPADFYIDYKFTPYSTGEYGLYFGAPNQGEPLYTHTNSFSKAGTANTVYTEQNMYVPIGSYNVTYLAPPESFLDLGDLTDFNIALFDSQGSLTKLETLKMGNKDRVPRYVKEIDGKYYSITGNEFKQTKTLLEDYTPNENETNPTLVNALRLQARQFNPSGFSVDSPSLKYLDFSNVDITKKQGPSDSSISNIQFTACPNVRKVYCRNSTLPRVSFLNGGYLEELLVSDYFENFTIQNQMLLKEENVIFENCLVDDERNPYRNLKTIIIENCKTFNSKEFLLKSLHQNNQIPNYNIPDSYVATGESVYKIIKITGIDYEKDAEGNPVTFKNEKGEDVYSHWVFRDNAEFETFVSNLEAYVTPDENGNQPVILTTSEDGKIKNKIHLEGSCYVLGAVDGGLKKRLKKLVEGDFNIYTSATSTQYTARFYYIDLITGQRMEILKSDGQPLTEQVYEGACVHDHYDPAIDLNTNKPTGSSGELNDDGKTINGVVMNYVPDYPEVEGYSYIHNYTYRKWLAKPRGELVTAQDVKLGLVTTNLSTISMEEDLDIYAVYTASPKKYWVSVSNKGQLVPGFENAVEVYYGDSLYSSINSEKRLPEEMEYPSDNEEERNSYDFAGWSPSPTSPIYRDTVIQATYNYKAYQTVTLLSKAIQEITIITDQIPDYRFVDCNNLKRVYISYQNNNKIVSLGENAFKNSRIYTDEEIDNGKYMENSDINGVGDLGKIYVPDQETKEKYLADSSWSQYSTSIYIGKKGEI